MTLLATVTLLALVGAAALLHAIGAYFVALVVLGAVSPRRAKASPRGPLPRIAVLVVAHDEERVIGDSVTALVAQRYEPERFAVYVVADHCSDGTCRVARAAGATVLERNEGRAEGKSAALAFGIDAAHRAGGFDAIAVFDADNVPRDDFLERVGARLATGERIVQGVVDAKNPSASWVAAASALGFWAIAAVAQAPRERLGLSTPLMGTGFAMSLADARSVLSGAASLTDDLDLGARLALSGIRVAHEPSALTLDEKPTSLAIAARQRHRWMQGRWAVAGHHLPSLLGRALGPRGGGLRERVRLLDVAVQLVAPSLLFTAVASLLVTSALALLRPWAPPGIADAVPLAALAGSFGAGATYYFVPAFGIARFRPSPFVWLCYLVQPAYLALSGPLAASGWLMRRRQKWTRTPKGAS
jgi:hypothetical protein